MDGDIGRDRYEVVEGFFKRPKGWTFVEVADVGVDADDNVYVFNRGTHPVMIFDRDGHFLDAWGEIGGEHYFTFPHGLSVGLDGYVYTADSRDQTIRKWTKDGRHVLTLGSALQHAPAISGKPFNRPTHAAVAASGDIYVSDGHGNDRVHCFSPDGELRVLVGRAGHRAGRVQHRPQRVHRPRRWRHAVRHGPLQQPGPVLHAGGEYLGEWGGLRLPQSVRKGPDGEWYVAELAHRSPC